MPPEYTPFTGTDFKKHVETYLATLTDIFAGPLKLIDVKDDELNKQNPSIKTWEQVYKMPTYSPVKTILIFSSVLKTTNITRARAKDRVRFVLRVCVDKEHHYWRIDRHNRTQNLFKRAEETINLGLRMSKQYQKIGDKSYIKNFEKYVNDDE